MINSRTAISLNVCVAVVAVTLLAVSTASQAHCWLDPVLSQRARELAQQLLPELDAVPKVFACTPDEFSGFQVGQFRVRGNDSAIRIHQYHAATPETRRMLVHELAHALTYQRHGALTFADGHGEEWMRVMVRLGPEQIEDARFHAGLFPEARGAFAQAMASVEPAERVRRGYLSNAQVAGTTIAAAEADRQNQSCARVLTVPPNGGMHGYVLGQHYRSFTPLPLGTDRIRVIRWVRPGTLELETLPTPDGTPSLLCLG